MRRARPVLFPLGALALWLGAASAQPAISDSGNTTLATDPTCIPAWDGFGASDELPSTIHASIRADDGFVYVGGRDGLYRIEGGTARAWTPDFSDQNALPAGRIAALEQFGGALWIGTAAGLAKLDLKSERIERISLPLGEQGRQAVLALKAHGDTLFIGTTSQVYALGSSANPKARLIPVEDGDPFKSVYAFAEIDGELIVASDRGLFDYSNEGSLSWLETPAGRAPVLGLATHSDGGVWALGRDRILAPASGAAKAWTALGREERPGLPAAEFTALGFDEMDRLWLGSRDGLSRSADNGASFVSCRRSVEADRDEGFSVAHLNGALGGYMFLGSYGRGATIAPLQTYVRRIVPGESFNPGLPAAPIWSTGKLPDGRLLLGTTQGLHVERTVSSGDFRELAPEVLRANRIFAIAPRGDEVWVGTNQGLVRIGPEGMGVAVPLLRDATGDVAPRVFTVKHTKAHTLLGTSSGMIVIDPQSGTPTQFYRTDEKHSAITDAAQVDLNGNRVWSIDAEGDQVLATGETGTWAIDLARGEVIASTDKALAEGQFNAGRIYSILGQGDGTVLLGTEAGLVETNREFSSFKSVTSINGMGLKSVMSSGRSADGRLWIGVAGSGVFHRMPNEPSWQHMARSDGLITNGVSQLGLSFPDDGSAIVSNATGASIIAPAAMARAPFDRFHLQASEVLRGEPIATGQVFSVGPERRDMRIRFMVPELLATGQYRVEYTLTQGGQVLQESNVPLSEDLIFPRLAIGEYQLTGRLASASGVHSEPLMLELAVAPFWWERQSTYAALFFLFAAAVAGLFWFRARSIERKFQIIADERRRIAHELHDSSLQDLFGAQMLGRSLKVDGSQDGAEGQKDQVLGLLKSATSSMRESVMTLRENPDTPSLTRAIGEFEPPAALSREVDIDFSEDGPHWSVGKHRRFFVARIAQEAINNAAKHAKASRISTRLNWSRWNLTIEVEDDGNGFDPEGPDYRGGHGREAMICMAQAVSGRLETLSAPGHGTTIRLQVPRFAL